MPMPGMMGANHHIQNYQPAFIDIYNNQMYPSPFIPEYNYMPPGYPIQIFINQIKFLYKMFII